MASNIGSLQGAPGATGDRGPTGDTGPRGDQGETPGSHPSYIRRTSTVNRSHTNSWHQVIVNSTEQSQNNSGNIDASGNNLIVRRPGIAFITAALMLNTIREVLMEVRINGTRVDALRTGNGYIERTGDRTHIHVAGWAHVEAGDTVSLWFNPKDSCTSDSAYTYFSVALI